MQCGHIEFVENKIPSPQTVHVSEIASRQVVLWEYKIESASGRLTAVRILHKLQSCVCDVSITFA